MARLKLCCSFVTIQYLRGRTKNKQTSRTIGRINKYAATMHGPARHNKAVAFVQLVVNHTVL